MLVRQGPNQLVASDPTGMVGHCMVLQLFGEDRPVAAAGQGAAPLVPGLAGIVVGQQLGRLVGVTARHLSRRLDRARSERERTAWQAGHMKSMNRPSGRAGRSCHTEPSRWPGTHRRCGPGRGWGAQPVAAAVAVQDVRTPATPLVACPLPLAAVRTSVQSVELGVHPSAVHRLVLSGVRTDRHPCPRLCIALSAPRWGPGRVIVGCGGQPALGARVRCHWPASGSVACPDRAW
jgi:hypothetical protein